MAKRRHEPEKWPPSKREHRHRFLTEENFEEAWDQTIAVMNTFLQHRQRERMMEMRGLEYKRASKSVEASTSTSTLVTKEGDRMKEARDLTFHVLM